jgi:putative DNA primase/helicase
MNVFSEFAPLYFKHGLPVIPVRGKAPVLQGWSRFCSEKPSEAEFSTWLNQYGYCGIGLPLGPASGLIAIDVDTDVELYKGLIDKELPPSPWKRVGAKGYVKIYRYNGENKQMLFEKNDQQGKKPFLELLSLGQQIVVPPSIHPTTGLPYEANCDLFDVLNDIGTLPSDFMQRLHDRFIAAGVEVSFTSASGPKSRVRMSEYVAAGGRDVLMTQLAGELAQDIQRGTKTFGDAIAFIDTWNRNVVERKQGDEIDPNKALQNLVKFLKRDVASGKRLPEGWDGGLIEEAIIHLGIAELREGPVVRKVESIANDFSNQLEADTPITDVIETLLNDLALSDSPGSLRETALLKQAAQTSRGVYTAADLKRDLKARRERLNEAADVAVAEDGHSALAQMMLNVMDAVEPAPYADGSLWDFDGEKYSKYGFDRLMLEIGNRFGGQELVKKTSDFKQVAAFVLVKAKEQVSLGQRPALVRAPVVNFRNGVLTEELELRPHSRQYGAHYVLDVEYDPLAADKCPMWLEMLRGYWGEDVDYEDKVHALRQAIAVSLFGVATRYERCFMLCGEGHNGKSTILKILEGLFPPELRSALALEDFDSRFGPVSLDGKLLNIAQEIKENAVINDKKLKEIISGNEMEVEQKGQPRYPLKPRAAHWFGMNNIPRVDETSRGFLRRLLMFEFTKEVSAGAKILELDQLVLRQERQAIICWAVSAIKGMRDFTIPASHEKLLNQFVARNNSILAWIRNSIMNQKMVIDQKAPFIAEDSVYATYRSWCGMSATSPARLDRFQRDMERAAREYGFKVAMGEPEKNQLPGYQGLKI